MIEIAVGLGFLALFAHVVKGVTGFGPAVVFVSIGSLIHDPVEIIVLASLLDIIGGGYLTFLNPDFLQNKDYWAPLGMLMVLGAVLGGAVLSIIPPTLFEYFLGSLIVLISFWFLLGKFKPEKSTEKSHEIGVLDGIVGTFSGFCGGFTGMGGPPLVAYLGSKFEKATFRALIVPVFLMAAIARFTTYGVTGMINTSNYWLYLFPPIGVIFGNYVGNHCFEKVEQRWFTILVGIILMLSGIRLVIG